jgi:hypothetical protein
MKSLPCWILAGMLLFLAPQARADSLIITGEPFLLANGEVFSIGGSAGEEARNRAAMPVTATLRRLYVLPNLQPAAGSIVNACVRANGVDTAMCVTYTSADWPNPKGTTVNTVTLPAGTLVTVHFTETGGVTSGANYRASFESSETVVADRIFADGFEGASANNAIVFTDEPFLVANGDVYSIGGSSGDIERNRAAAPRDGTVRSLYVIPNLQPLPGSQILACVRVNDVDAGLCVTYNAADWPAAKGATNGAVAVAQGDLISVHFTETNGANSGANVRASLNITASTATGGAIAIAGEPFIVNNADVYTIQGSNGTIDRNRATAPRAGTIRNLFLAPNLQPAPGTLIHGCVNVNGVDTALCVNISDEDWPGARGNTSTTVSVNAGDVISVHFTELGGVFSGSNVRTSFQFD